MVNDALNVNYINVYYVTDSLNSGEKWLIPLSLTISTTHKVPYQQTLFPEWIDNMRCIS